MPIPCTVGHFSKAVGILHAVVNLEKGIRAMMKTLEAINEAVRNPKHPFRKTDNHPKKADKNRYERRKIREYLQLTDWLAEEAI
jgi:hypothetical protein